MPVRHCSSEGVEVYAVTGQSELRKKKSHAIRKMEHSRSSSLPIPVSLELALALASAYEVLIEMTH